MYIVAVTIICLYTQEDNYFYMCSTRPCTLCRPVRVICFFSQPIMLCSKSFRISLLCFQISLLCFVVLPILDGPVQIAQLPLL